MLLTFMTLWREARWPARLLFLAMCGLFLFRAGFVEAAHPGGDREGFMRVGAQVLDGRLYSDPEVNTYPPPFAVVMAPLEAARRVVGDRPVRYLWGGAQIAALVVFTIGFGRLLALPLSLGAIAIGWLCTWRYIVGDLNNQNTTLLLLAVLTAASTLAARGRAGASGVLLGIGAAVKVWPAAAIWALLWSGLTTARRVIAGFALGIAAAAIVTVGALGPGRAFEAARFWLTVVGPRVGGPALLNQSWRGFFYRMFMPAPDLEATMRIEPGPGVALARAVAAGVGLSVLASVVILVAVRRARSPRGRALDALLLAFALLPALPVTWFHYFTVGLPIVLAVASGSSLLDRRARVATRALVGLGTLLGALFDVDIVGRAAWRAVAFYGNALWGALLVFAAGLVLREAWRIQDAGPAPQSVASSGGASGAVPLGVNS